MTLVIVLPIAIVIAWWAIPRYLKMLDQQYERNSAALFAPDTCEELDPIPWIDDDKWNAAIDPYVPTDAELDAMFNYGGDDVH